MIDRWVPGVIAYPERGSTRSDHVLCSPNFLCSFKIRHGRALTKQGGTVLAWGEASDCGR